MNLVSDSVITALTAHQSDWILVCFFYIICSDWKSAETECIDVFFNDHLNMLIRWSDRSAWLDWLSAKVNYLSVKLDKEFVIWNFIVNSIINFEVQIKTSDVKSNVKNVVSDIKNWSYFLKFDDVIVIVCFCENSSNKNSKFEIRISFQFSYQ